jgi:DNA repair protein RadA
MVSLSEEVVDSRRSCAGVEITVKKTPLTVRQFKRSSMKGTVAKARASSFAKYSTGSPELDQVANGALREGRLIVAYGKSGCGKTQLAMQTVMTAAHSGVKSLYVDAEGGFRPERIEEMARARAWSPRPILEKIVYLRCSSSAEQTEVVRRMSRDKRTSECRVVAIDTLTRNFSLDFPGSDNMPDRQGALDVHLSQMSRDAVLHGRGYMLTNRVTFGASNQDVGVGGTTIGQLVHAALHMQKEGDGVTVEVEPGGMNAHVAIGRAGIGV